LQDQLQRWDGCRDRQWPQGGAGDDGQAGLYRDFVLDLHARLAALGNSSIAFTGGFGEARYKFGIGLMIVVGLFFLALPLVLMLITGETKILYTLYCAVLLAWLLYKVVVANRPQAYDPRSPPEELIGAPREKKNWLSWIQN
jgi:hypothetical protein